MENNYDRMFPYPVLNYPPFIFPPQLPSSSMVPRAVGPMQALMLAQRQTHLVRCFNPRPTRIYRCKECGSAYPTPQALGGHVSSHTKKRRFQGKLAKTIEELAMERKARDNHRDVPPPPPPSPRSPPPPPPAVLPHWLRAKEGMGENYPYGRGMHPAVKVEEDDALSDDGSCEGSVTSGIYYPN